MRHWQTVNRLIVTVALIVASRSAEAATSVTYDVAVNTAPLIGHPAGPFSIMFALTDGSGFSDGNNTVIITPLDFGGGMSLGSPSLWGGASGSLETSVTLVDSDLIALFTESFSSGTILRLSVSLTTNDDEGGVPDRLTMFIVDSAGRRVPTLASGGDFFFGVDLTSAGGLPEAFGSDTSRAPTVGGPISFNTPVAQFVSRAAKETIRASLTALLSMAGRETTEELHEAIRRIDESLATYLWADDIHLTERGETVFEEEERAVRDLLEIRRAPASLLNDIANAAVTLTRVDRELAQTALVEAQQAGADTDRLSRATKDIVRGDQFAGSGALLRAIESYEDAWLDVQRARHLRSDDDDAEHHHQEDRH